MVETDVERKYARDRNINKKILREKIKWEIITKMKLR
jgi:hypothetical protein